MSITNQELDRIANEYHMNTEVPDMHIENLCQEYFIEWLLKLVKPGMQVLELGYGDGLVTSALAKSGCKLTLLEGSGILAELATKKHPNINCIYTFFEQYVPAKPFDLILAAHVLEHLDDPVAMLKMMSPWLSNDGVLIVVVPNQNSLHRKLAVSMGLQPQLDTLSKRDLMVGHQRVYSLEQLESHIKNANFKIIKKAGFFVKMLPNSMMLEYSRDLLWAMNSIASDLPVELTANLAIVASQYSAKENPS